MENKPKGPHIKLVISWAISALGLIVWGGFVGVATAFDIEIHPGWGIVLIVLFVINYATAFAERKY